jgi:hypothetical protein
MDRTRKREYEVKWEEVSCVLGKKVRRRSDCPREVEVGVELGELLWALECVRGKEQSDRTERPRHTSHSTLATTDGREAGKVWRVTFSSVGRSRTCTSCTPSTWTDEDMHSGRCGRQTVENLLD